MTGYHKYTYVHYNYQKNYIKNKEVQNPTYICKKF